MRKHKQRGATLVEFTFLIPVLMTIALGMFEMGLAWRDKVTVTQATRMSSRTLTRLGTGDTDGDGNTDIDVDREGLLALRASMFEQWDNVEFVVIYRSDINGDMESDDCKSGSESGDHCNYYGPAELAELDNAASPIWDHNGAPVAWDWEDRNNNLVTADHVGVFVQISHAWESGFFPGDGLTISESAVLRMEPTAG